MYPKLNCGSQLRETHIQDPRSLIKSATIKYDNDGNQLIEDYNTHYKVAYYNAEENKSYWYDNNVEYAIGNVICLMYSNWVNKGKGPALG